MLRLLTRKAEEAEEEVEREVKRLKKYVHAMEEKFEYERRRDRIEKATRGRRREEAEEEE